MGHAHGARGRRQRGCAARSAPNRPANRRLRTVVYQFAGASGRDGSASRSPASSVVQRRGDRRRLIALSASAPAGVRFDAETWSADQRAAAAEQMHTHGFAIVENAVSAAELRALSAWVATSQSQHPKAWPVDERDGQRLYSQPLLGDDAEALDAFLRPVRTFPVIDQLLGGEACFAQLDFRDCPCTDQRSSKDHFHHDTGAANTSDPDVIAARLFGRHDTLCQVLYLNSVGPSSTAFAVIAGSHRVPVRRPPSVVVSGSDRTISCANTPIAGWQRWWEQQQIEAALGAPPLRIEAPAGTAVLYDVSLFHSKAVSPHGSQARLTLHQYFGRLSNKPNVDWALLPRRLAESKDEAVRRFCGNLTPVQSAYAQCGYDLRSCAASKALRAHLLLAMSPAQREVMGAAELQSLCAEFLAQHAPEAFA